MLSEIHRRLLFSLCLKDGLPVHVIDHPWSMSAADKQRLLPAGVAVQKTLTVVIGFEHDLYLLSGLTDFLLTRPAWRGIFRHLGYSRRQQHLTVNPAWFPAKDLTGIEAGMVSPFLPPPSEFSPAHLKGILLLNDTRVVQNYPISAISLSLTRSLLLPSSRLIPFMYHYAAEVYPHLPMHTLDMAAFVDGETSGAQDAGNREGFGVVSQAQGNHSGEHAQAAQPQTVFVSAAWYSQLRGPGAEDLRQTCHAERP